MEPRATSDARFATVTAANSGDVRIGFVRPCAHATIAFHLPPRASPDTLQRHTPKRSRRVSSTGPNRRCRGPSARRFEPRRFPCAGHETTGQIILPAGRKGARRVCGRRNLRRADRSRRARPPVFDRMAADRGRGAGSAPSPAQVCSPQSRRRTLAPDYRFAQAHAAELTIELATEGSSRSACSSGAADHRRCDRFHERPLPERSGASQLSAPVTTR